MTDVVGGLALSYTFTKTLHPMKNKLLLITILMMTFATSCKKDIATNWLGTYNGTAGNNTVQRVVVTKVNEKTIKLELQTLFFGTYVSFATIANGKLNSATSLTVDEDGTVTGQSGTYHFSGFGTRDGNVLSVTGQATRSGSSTLYYVFTGSK
jgi:hypothetical protein